MAGGLSVRARVAGSTVITAAMFAAVVIGALSVAPARAAELRDPMRPATLRASAPAQPPANAPLKLEAVMSSPGSRVAIVDGKVVRTGDRVSGALITEITADSIRYSRGGKEQIALLPANKVTVRANPTLQAGQP